MKLPKIFNFKKFVEKSGTLLPMSFNHKFPIKVKRIFIIYGRKKYKRGDHAHKKCSQVFLPILGKIKINLKYKQTKKSILLSHKQSKALFVPPVIWGNLEFLTNNSVKCEPIKPAPPVTNIFLFSMLSIFYYSTKINNFLFNFLKFFLCVKRSL